MVGWEPVDSPRQLSRFPQPSLSHSQRDNGSVSGMSLLNTFLVRKSLQANVLHFCAHDSSQLDQSAYNAEAAVILTKHEFGFGFGSVWFGCGVFNTRSPS